QFYSRTNTDGNPFTNPRAMKLPGTPAAGGDAAWPGTHCFPTYTDDYADGLDSTEGRNNPLMFNFLNPGQNSYYRGGRITLRYRVFPTSNLEALLRYSHKGSPALTSDLFLLCPQSFQNAAVTSQNHVVSQRRRPWLCVEWDMKLAPPDLPEHERTPLVLLLLDI